MPRTKSLAGLLLPTLLALALLGGPLLAQSPRPPLRAEPTRFPNPDLPPSPADTRERPVEHVATRGYTTIGDAPTLKKRYPGEASASSGLRYAADMEEDFEGYWPTTGWDRADTTNGQYTWGRRTCHPNTGNYAAWCIGGGSAGAYASCSRDYESNYEAWARYGPFSLADTQDAQIVFSFWGVAQDAVDEDCVDYMFIGVSTDGNGFLGWSVCGDATDGPDGNGYFREALPLSDWIGEDQVWIAFMFHSDSYTQESGYHIDNLEVAVQRPTATPTRTRTSTVTRTPTRTQTATCTRTTTPTPTGTRTPTVSRTPTTTRTPTVTRTPSKTRTATTTRTSTRTRTPTRTGTPTRTDTPTRTPVHSPTPTVYRSPTPTPKGWTLVRIPLVMHMPTPTPTRTRGPGTELLVNGDFEDDDGWEMPATRYSADYTDEMAHGGKQSMRLGVVEESEQTYSYSPARQAVTIPANALSATVGFWVYPISGEAKALAAPPHPLAPSIQEATLASDAQYLLVLNPYNTWIDTLWFECRDDQEWVYMAYDLMPFAGRTIKLHFGVYNNGVAGVTGMYLDDVSVLVETP